jgi:hypothetical protein
MDAAATAKEKWRVGAGGEMKTLSRRTWAFAEESKAALVEAVEQLQQTVAALQGEKAELERALTDATKAASSLQAQVRELDREASMAWRRNG